MNKTGDLVSAHEPLPGVVAVVCGREHDPWRRWHNHCSLGERRLVSRVSLGAGKVRAPGRESNSLAGAAPREIGLEAMMVGSRLRSGGQR